VSAKVILTFITAS